jgi:hypothetical protein
LPWVDAAGEAAFVGKGVNFQDRLVAFDQFILVFAIGGHPFGQRQSQWTLLRQ